MLETVLVASDLSAASDSLVRCAAGLRRLGARRALLVHALCMRHYRDMRPVVEPLVAPRLRAQAEMLERAGMEVATEVLPGQACEEILHAAANCGASCIVMATRSGSLLHDWLTGSTVLRVLGKAGRPVLVLQAREDDAHWTCCRQTGAWLGDHLLHPTDFTDASERAFSIVGRLAAEGAARVTLLHVQPPARKNRPGWREESDQLDAARLSRLAGEVRACSRAQVEGILREGDAAEGILRMAAELGATMIVMGTQGHGVAHEVLLGSVSHHVLRHAPVPVLLAPPAAALRAEEPATAEATEGESR